MAQRSITIPADLTLQGPDGQEVPFSFKAYLDTVIFADQRWALGFDAALKARDLLALLSVEPGEVVELQESDWRKLCECVNSPMLGNNGIRAYFFRQMLPYMDAIKGGENASKK